MMGVRLGPGFGVPVADLSSLSLSSLGSEKVSRLRRGVVGLSIFSGDLGVDWAGESRPPPSIIRLRSLTDAGCRDCMRRCEEGRKDGRSGEVSAIRLGTCGTKAFSRAFSARAAWAVWMADEVPVLETLGDWGLRGSGGGARSGSELSHLFFISVRQRADMTWSSWVARVEEGMDGMDGMDCVDGIHGDQSTAID